MGLKRLASAGDGHFWHTSRRPIVVFTLVLVQMDAMKLYPGPSIVLHRLLPSSCKMEQGVHAAAVLYLYGNGLCVSAREALNV